MCFCAAFDRLFMQRADLYYVHDFVSCFSRIIIQKTHSLCVFEKKTLLGQAEVVELRKHARKFRKR